MTLKEWIDKEMKTPKEIARKVGCTGATVRRWINGQSGISVKHRRNFKEEYGVDPVKDLGVSRSMTGYTGRRRDG